jgi:serine protease Do
MATRRLHPLHVVFPVERSSFMARTPLFHPTARGSRRVAGALAVLALIGATAQTQALSWPEWLKAKPQTQTPTSVAAPATTPQPAPVPLADASATPDYRAIVKRFGPAVVGITVSGFQKTSDDAGDGPEAGDPFFEFFRHLPGYMGPGRAPSETPFKGMGSGFVVSADGLILTNAHVVRNARSVTVRFADRRELPAKVLGSDTLTDVAVLRVDAKDLPTVRLGDPSQTEVGDRVLAIGAPYGLEQTATQGIISAKGRALPGESVVPFLQTDAAVNPGNSGGPLFDGQGQVIGINAQIYTRSGGFQGLSFAIPIDVALQVKDQIVATGHANHARLGVSVQDLNQALADSFGLPKPDGAVVAQVIPRSPAARAGLKAGDVVTQVDGKPIRQAAELSSLIGLSNPSATVSLHVWRDRQWKDLSVKLGNASDETETASTGAPQDSGQRLGLAVRPLNRAEKAEVAGGAGVRVESVDGAAARAGVEPGDVVVAINGRPVQSVDTLRQVVGQHPGTVALLVWRDHQQIFIPVPLS